MTILRFFLIQTRVSAGVTRIFVVIVVGGFLVWLIVRRNDGVIIAKKSAKPSSVTNLLDVAETFQLI